MNRVLTAEQRSHTIVHIASNGRIGIEVLGDDYATRGVSLVALDCIGEPYGTYLRRRIAQEIRSAEQAVVAAFRATQKEENKCQTQP